MPAIRTRQPRGGVKTHRLERSLRAVTLDPLVSARERAERIAEIGAEEVDSQHEIVLSGQAGSLIDWTEAELRFEVIFLPAGHRRNAPFEQPHFTYGAVVLSPTPVVLEAVVTEWLKSDGGETTGARVALGAHSPGTDAPIEFRGELHLTFQGYGHPNLYDDQDD